MRRLRIGVRAQLYIDLLLVLATLDSKRHRVAHIVRAQGDDQAICRGNLLVVNLGNNIALLNARLICWAAGNNLANISALIDRKVILARVGCGHRTQANTHIRMLRRLATDDLLGDLHRIVRRNGKAHA